MMKEKDELENEFDDEVNVDQTSKGGKDNAENADVSAPQDYTMRHILLWEEDETRRNMSLEFLSDLLTGATIRAYATEEEAIEALDEDDWDTFVIDLMNENVSSSEFVKRANNYPAAILVAISFAFLELEERDPVKLEQIRRLFDVEKNATPLRA